MMYENYLEHHGVKGMRWGVRRQKARQLSGARRKTLTDDEKRARRRKIIKGVAIGAGVAAAAYGVHRLRKDLKDTRDFHNKLKYGVTNRNYGDVKDNVAKKWDHYTLRTKKKFMNADTKGTRTRFLATYYDTKPKSKITLSSQHEMSVRNRDYKRIIAAQEKAARAKEQADYIRNMASKTAAKNTSRNPGDRPDLDSNYAAVKRMYKEYDEERAKDRARVEQRIKAEIESKRVPSRKVLKKKDTTGIDDFTQELLKKNAKRLAKAGH